MDQNPRFAATGSRYHQQVLQWSGHGLALSVVQVFEYVGDVQACNLRRGPAKTASGTIIVMFRRLLWEPTRRFEWPHTDLPIYGLAFQGSRSFRKNVTQRDLLASR